MCDENWSSESDFKGTWILDTGEKTFTIEIDGNQLTLILPGSPPEHIPATYTPQNGEPAHVDVTGEPYAFIPDGCEGGARKALLVVNARTLQVSPTQNFHSDVPTEGERYIEEDVLGL